MPALRTTAPLVPAVTVSLAAVLLAGCTSSGAPGPRSTTRTAVAPTPAHSTSGPPVLSAALPRTPDALASAMRRGLAVTTTAHLAITGVPGHRPVTGAMTLAGGTPTSLALTSGSGAAALHVVVVNSVGYVRTGSGRWLPVPATGRVPALVRRARAVLGVARRLGDPHALLSSVGAARLHLLGRGAVGAVPAAHYRLTRGAARSSTSLWVDGGSRPLVVGRAGAGTVRFTRYGAAVHISAPAPSQISR